MEWSLESPEFSLTELKFYFVKMLSPKYFHVAPCSMPSFDWWNSTSSSWKCRWLVHSQVTKCSITSWGSGGGGLSEISGLARQDGLIFLFKFLYLLLLILFEDVESIVTSDSWRVTISQKHRGLCRGERWKSCKSSIYHSQKSTSLKVIPGIFFF